MKAAYLNCGMPSIASKRVKSSKNNTLLIKCTIPLVQPKSQISSLARTPPPSTYTSGTIMNNNY